MWTKLNDFKAIDEARGIVVDLVTDLEYRKGDKVLRLFADIGLDHGSGQECTVIFFPYPLAWLAPHEKTEITLAERACIKRDIKEGFHVMGEPLSLDEPINA